MTQELADKLIAWYTDTVAALGSELDEALWRKILATRHTDKGICWCAYKVWGEHVYNDSWIDKQWRIAPNRLSVGHWCITPRYCLSKAQIMQVLQVRIDILKTYNP